MGNKHSSHSSKSSKSLNSSKNEKTIKVRKTCAQTKPIGDSDWDVPPGSFKMYQTHDNGGRTFRVFVDTTNNVAVITHITPTEWQRPCYPYVVNKRFTFQRVWVGKSPKLEMTEHAFNGGYGPEFDGNSILFDLGKNKYMKVGESVTLFNTSSPILDYVSPVGQNDVPYPWAVDKAGFYYLLGLGDHIKVKFHKKPVNPYDVYHDWKLFAEKGDKKPFTEEPLQFETLVPRLS